MNNVLSYDLYVEDVDRLRMMIYGFLTLCCVMNYMLVEIDEQIAILYWILYNIVALGLRYLEFSIDKKTYNRFLLDVILKNPFTQIFLIMMFGDKELFLSLKLIPETISALYFMLYFRAQYSILIGMNAYTNYTTKYSPLVVLELLSRIVIYTIIFCFCKNIFPWIFPLLLELLTICLDVDRLITIDSRYFTKLITGRTHIQTISHHGPLFAKYKTE